MHHLGLILTMIAGYVGMHASSESDFEKCLKAKANFVQSMHKLDNSYDDAISYMKPSNDSYMKILVSCIPLKYGCGLDELAFIHQLKARDDIKAELFRDNTKYSQSQKTSQCNQLRKDFVAALASVQNKED
jgi:hypothetical protein